MSSSPPTKNERREKAVCNVARAVFHLDLSMEHRDSERQITMHELRRALEQAYDLGRQSALS